MEETVIITVRAAYGTYQTNTVRGLRASCTGGEQSAAEALARKLYPGQVVVAEPAKSSVIHGMTYWRIHVGQAT